MYLKKNPLNKIFNDKMFMFIKINGINLILYDKLTIEKINT